MTDKADFSLDVSIDPASGLKPLPDRVAFDLCKAYPVPGGHLLLHNTRTGKRAMVMPEVYASLLRCSQFQTLDQHVANLIEVNPAMQGQQADIRNVLRDMLDQGIMVSAKQTCDALKRKYEAPPGNKEPGAPVVAVITWERPEALERLLKSIVVNCNTSNLHCLYVIDDSRKTENINRNRELVARFASRIKSPLQYFGQEQQQSLLTGLIKQLPDHENAIRFLADQSRWRDHWTSGLARNVALLLSCERRLVMMDDDTVCEVYSPQQVKPNITISDEQREADFFNSEQGWKSLHKAINPDPVDRHMQCLGLSFSEALEVLGQNHLKPAGLTNATALMVSELHQESPILITECGSLGCPGTGANTWLPDMAPEALKQMLASGQKTRNALNSRFAWVGRNQPHFASRSNMSAMTGLDNRQLLPPYLPMIRGEDRLFGNMLDFIFPLAITLDYPWAVPHLPIPQREWNDKDRDFTPPDSFPMFFLDQLVEQKSTCLAGSPEDRLEALSAWLGNFASAGNESLSTMYQDARLQDTSQQLQKLDRLLSQAESAPADWQEYLQDGIQQLGADMDRSSQEDLVVKGVPNTLENDELIAFWKETWTGFAAAVKAWPEIRKAAARIASPAQVIQ